VFRHHRSGFVNATFPSDLSEIDDRGAAQLFFLKWAASELAYMTSS
jgi:hypothetical protein